jgi:hypothetical protein
MPGSSRCAAANRYRQVKRGRAGFFETSSAGFQGFPSSNVRFFVLAKVLAQKIGQHRETAGSAYYQ